MSHVFAGGHDDDSEAALEKFKARTGLKSVPFYVVLAGDGRIEQVGERVFFRCVWCFYLCVEIDVIYYRSGSGCLATAVP